MTARPCRPRAGPFRRSWRRHGSICRSVRYESHGQADETRNLAIGPRHGHSRGAHSHRSLCHLEPVTLALTGGRSCTFTHIGTKAARDIAIWSAEPLVNWLGLRNSFGPVGAGLRLCRHSHLEPLSACTGPLRIFISAGVCTSTAAALFPPQWQAVAHWADFDMSTFRGWGVPLAEH